MSDDLPSSKSPLKSALQTLAAELTVLHKLLLQAAKADWERTHGTFASPMAFFQVITHEPTFGPWLKPMTQLLTLLDEFLEGDERPTSLEAAVIRRDAAPLVTPGGAEDPYARILQENPEVTVAHAAVKRALEALPPASEEETTSESLHEKHAWIEGRRHARRQSKLELLRLSKRGPKQ